MKNPVKKLMGLLIPSLFVLNACSEENPPWVEKYTGTYTVVYSQHCTGGIGPCDTTYMMQLEISNGSTQSAVKVAGWPDEVIINAYGYGATGSGIMVQFTGDSVAVNTRLHAVNWDKYASYRGIK